MCAEGLSGALPTVLGLYPAYERDTGYRWRSPPRHRMWLNKVEMLPCDERRRAEGNHSESKATGESPVYAISGLMVSGPTRRTAGNGITPRSAKSLCVARPNLDYLRYAVHVRGYFHAPLFLGGDAPPPPEAVTLAPAEPRAKQPDTLMASGFSLPHPGWYTVPGILTCSAREPAEFCNWS